MNKINIKFFALLLLIFISFLSGCNNLVGGTAGSSLSNKKKVISNATNLKQSNPKIVRDVQVSFFLADSQIVLNQPVLLKFVIQNGLEQSIKLDLGQNFKEGFLFTVISPDGRRSQLAQLRRDGLSLKGNLSLKPQETYTQKIILNEWTEFTTSGNYVIEGRLANPIKTENGETVVIDSGFSIGLEIKPENVEHLKEVSDDLFNRLIESKTYAEAAEAALILGYVKDSVAVPYLYKALISNKIVEPIVITGLERVGNKDSVQVLINVINEKPESELAALAKSALERIQNQSSDLEVKEMIKQVLKVKQKPR